MARGGWLVLVMVPATAAADEPVATVHADAEAPGSAREPALPAPMDPLAGDHLMTVEPGATWRFRLGQRGRGYLDADHRSGDLWWKSWRTTANVSYDLGRVRLTTAVSYENMQSWLGNGPMIDASVTLDTTLRIAGHPFVLGLTTGVHRWLGRPIADPIIGASGASAMLTLRTKF
jgi:hypothetical protein